MVVSRSESLRMVRQLPPGSDRAIEKGCTCPVMDNGHGNGYMGQKNVYVMNENCPLHGLAIKFDKKEEKNE